MLGALLAAEPGFTSLAQILPCVIGAVFTLGVIVVGLVMSRKSSAETPSVADGTLAPPVTNGPAEQQAPPIYVAPNPLLKLVLPAAAVLILGSGILFVVIPLFQDLSEAKESFDSTMKSNFDTAIQSANNPSPQFQTGPAVTFQPIQLPPQPQIHVPPYVPPPPHIPHTYVDSKGFVRTR